MYMFFMSRRQFEDSVTQKLIEERMRRDTFEQIDRLEQRIADLEIRLCNLEAKVNTPEYLVMSANENKVGGSNLNPLTIPM